MGVGDNRPQRECLNYTPNCVELGELSSKSLPDENSVVQLCQESSPEGRFYSLVDTTKACVRPRVRSTVDYCAWLSASRSVHRHFE